MQLIEVLGRLSVNCRHDRQESDSEPKRSWRESSDGATTGLMFLRQHCMTLLLVSEIR